MDQGRISHTSRPILIGTNFFKVYFPPDKPPCFSGGFVFILDFLYFSCYYTYRLKTFNGGWEMSHKVYAVCLLMGTLLFVFAGRWMAIYPRHEPVAATSIQVEFDKVVALDSLADKDGITVPTCVEAMAWFRLTKHYADRSFSSSKRAEAEQISIMLSKSARLVNWCSLSTQINMKVYSGYDNQSDEVAQARSILIARWITPLS